MTDKQLARIFWAFMAVAVVFCALAAECLLYEYRKDAGLDANKVAYYQMDGWKCVAVTPTDGRREMVREKQ